MLSISILVPFYIYLELNKGEELYNGNHWMQEAVKEYHIDMNIYHTTSFKILET